MERALPCFYSGSRMVWCGYTWKHLKPSLENRLQTVRVRWAREEAARVRPHLGAPAPMGPLPYLCFLARCIPAWCDFKNVDDRDGGAANQNDLEWLEWIPRCLNLKIFTFCIYVYIIFKYSELNHKKIIEMCFINATLITIWLFISESFIYIFIYIIFFWIHNYFFLHKSFVYSLKDINLISSM